MAMRLMNEIVFNHLKAYYQGVHAFKCPILRDELQKKIDKFKERMNRNRDRSNDDSGINFSSPEENQSVKPKRKRTDDDDDDKENARKIMIQSSSGATKQRTMIATKSSDTSDKNQFDHQYSDMMYDNEFEGLQLFHFEDYDLEPSEDRLLISSPVTLKKDNSSEFGQF